MYWLMPTCCSQRSTELFPSSPGNRPGSSVVLNTLDAADTSLVLRVDEAGRRYNMLLEAALTGLLGMHQPKASAFPGVGSCGVGPPCGGLGCGRMGLLLSGSLASRTVVVERCAQHHMAVVTDLLGNGRWQVGADVHAPTGLPHVPHDVEALGGGPAWAEEDVAQRLLVV